MGCKISSFCMLAIGFWLFIASVGFVLADPTGPDSINITENSSWAGSGTGALVNTSGGYLSVINVSANVQNVRWKAFVGWIQGSFTLDDSSGNSVYDWSSSTSGGEVYATRASGSITWGSIGCATGGQIDTEDTVMEHTGEDNISSTFSGTNTGTYTVAGTGIGAGTCSATYSYVNNVTQSSAFEEFILYDSSNIVFAANIEDAVAGYDGADYDFQMIVPENGNSSFQSSTSYYLYVELS